jgi:hypothetical protein
LNQAQVVNQRDNSMLREWDAATHVTVDITGGDGIDRLTIDSTFSKANALTSVRFDGGAGDDAVVYAYAGVDALEVRWQSCDTAARATSLRGRLIEKVPSDMVAAAGVISLAAIATRGDIQRRQRLRALQDRLRLTEDSDWTVDGVERVLPEGREPANKGPRRPRLFAAE